MKASIWAVSALLLAPGPLLAQKKAETSHLGFVTEYIRELSAVDQIRTSGERENKQDPKGMFSIMIHTATLMKLELGAEILTLKDMRLNDPFAEVIPDLTKSYESRIDLWQQMIDISSEFV